MITHGENRETIMLGYYRYYFAFLQLARWDRPFSVFTSINIILIRVFIIWSIIHYSKMFITVFFWQIVLLFKKKKNCCL